MLFAKIFEGSFPELMVGNAQRDLVGNHQQGGMIQEALVIGVREDTESLGGGVMGKIELGGILNGQDGALRLQSFFSGCEMGRYNGLIGDLVVIKESIGGFGDLPRATGLRNGGGRMVCEDLSDQGEAFGETQIVQFGFAEFGLCPGFFLILSQRWFCS